jgi:hypothetical protein
MSFQAVKPLLVASLLAALSACGGSDNNSNPTTPTSDFNSNLQTSVATAATSAGLTSATTTDLIDAAYKDSGNTRTSQLAYLQAEATAITANTDLSGFVGYTVSNIQISNCESNNVCTMTATLTNTDADTTTADITTKVKQGTDGKYRLYGDQLSA